MHMVKQRKPVASGEKKTRCQLSHAVWEISQVTSGLCVSLHHKLFEDLQSVRRVLRWD